MTDFDVALSSWFRRRCGEPTFPAENDVDWSVPLSIDVENDLGYRYSSWTYDDGHVSVVVNWRSVRYGDSSTQIVELGEGTYSLSDLVKEIIAEGFALDRAS